MFHFLKTRRNVRTAWTGAALLLAAALGSAPAARAQSAIVPTDTSIPHLEKNGAATQLIVDGKPFLCISGELHNSSCSSREYMAPIWDKLQAMKLNSVIGSLSWELVEPEEGKFDFSNVDEVITDAREHNIKLVLIWFASWKNANNDYCPAWVKKDMARFPRAQDSQGRSLGTMCALGEETMKADARAFAATMKHIKEFDKNHTVITMQVENETGQLGEARDHSPLAEAAFQKQVPAALIDFIKAKKDNLVPEFKQIWGNGGFKESGTWSEVFGKDADEMFQAWNIGRYVGTVAAAGKAEYPIPMYANSWLNYGGNGTAAGRYPSGGPVAKSINVWQAAAPAIDMRAPDIYVDVFKQVCTEFHASGNPLFIPETRGGALGAARSIYAFAEHDAICFAPFGIDSQSVDTPLTPMYEWLGNVAPLILQYQGTGKMHGAFQDATSVTQEQMTLGDYRLTLTWGGDAGGRGGRGGRGAGGRGMGAGRGAVGGTSSTVFGAGVSRRGAGAPVLNGVPALAGAPAQEVPPFALVIALGPDDFLFAGSGYSVQFRPLTPGDAPVVELLSVDEGKIVGGKWVAGRRLNGDERPRSVSLRRMAPFSPAAPVDPALATMFRAQTPSATPAVLRVKVYRHK